MLYTYINRHAGTPDENKTKTLLVHMCLCFLPIFILDIKFVGRNSRVTQEEDHREFLIYLLSAVRALIFLARRIQPFLSLVDREVGFRVLTI